MAQTVPAGLADALSRLLSGTPDRAWTTASGAVLAVRDDLVVKVHPAGTDGAALAARLRTAAAPALEGVLAAPLRPAAEPVDDRLATLWPRLDVLAPDTPAAPWAQAARTLAWLHRTPPPDAGLPPHGAPDRLARAVGRLRPHGGAAAEAVRRAGRQVLADVAGTTSGGTTAGRAGDGRDGPQPARLVHGDWHLGQLGRDAAERWLLLDLDDLGTGDPAWDLGRPAGFHAAGLLDDASWTAFLTAYRAAAGPALPADGDPWPVLDVPARAEVVVAAARAVDRVLRGAEGWDDEVRALVDACARMTG